MKLLLKLTKQSMRTNRMRKNLTRLLIISLLAALLTACSRPFQQVAVIQDKTALKESVPPMPMPTSRSFQGMNDTVNWALRLNCLLKQYWGEKLPSYCPRPKTARRKQ